MVEQFRGAVLDRVVSLSSSLKPTLWHRHTRVKKPSICDHYMIQEALSSHISVAPTCRKLKPRSNARKWTASWTACDAATNSVSALLRVTPPCRELRHETAPSLSLKRYLVIDLRVSGCAAKSLSTQPVSLLRSSDAGSQYAMSSF